MHKEDIFLGLWMLRMNIWMFHKTGVPLNHPFIDRFSIVVNPPSLGTPMYGTPCIIYIYIMCVYVRFSVCCYTSINSPSLSR